MDGRRWRRAILTLAVLLLGALGGAVIFGYLGFQLGQWFLDRFMPWAELEGLAAIAAGIALGVWIGAALGSWLALRALRRPAAGLTALVMSGLMPAWLFVPVGAARFFSLEPGLPLMVAALVIALLLARALAVVAARAGPRFHWGASAFSVAATLVGGGLWGRFFYDISGF